MTTMGAQYPRILFVAMSNSVHAAHWIRQLSGTEWDVHLFPCEKPGLIHTDFADLTVHDVGLYRPVELAPSIRVSGLWPFPRGAYGVSQLLKRLGRGDGDRALMLARLIKKLAPDIVHTLEMQHSGYLTLRAHEQMAGRFPPWIYTSWGSDLYYFGRQEEHHSRVCSVLGVCDYHVSDCDRDIGLAREFGFQGESLGVFPGPGGYPVNEMQKRAGVPASKRRLIMVKGQDHWAGRALIALEAIHRCADVLNGYEICVYYTTPGVAEVARHIQKMTGLNIRVLEGYRPHDEIIDLMGQARVALALAVTDGTPNSMLEAMIMGAFPIQSDTGAIHEWIESGANGWVVPSEDAGAVVSALRRAVQDDELVDRAMSTNQRLARARIDETVVRPRVLQMYADVLLNEKRRRK
jgi:glycosyltransferase involved in cell wall biosynthesis